MLNSTVVYIVFRRTLTNRIVRAVICSIVILGGGIAMAQEGEGNYLSDAETVEEIYAYMQQDKIDSATSLLKGLGDDKQVVQTWIGVQCDLNNVKQDPLISAKIGLAGVDYCLEKDYKLPAAMMLHNVSAFFTPNFDEGVDPVHIPMILDAARRQVTLRREINQPGPLIWALWDLGVAELTAGNANDAIQALKEGARIADENNDRGAAAWCRLFMGKTKVKLIPDLKEEGERELRDAVAIISEIGQDWEKDEIKKVMKSVGLSD